MSQPSDGRRIDRSFQTDERAKPARPDGGAASGVSGRGMRLAVSGGALTALLAVVAVASRAHKPGGSGGAGTPHAPTLFFDYVASAMIVLFPLGVIIVI